MANALTAFDNTMLQAFCRCPRQFEHRHINHLVPAEGGTSPALNFGKSIHKALEVLYKTGDKAASIQAFKDTFDPSATDDKRNVEGGMILLFDYFNKWLPENLEILNVEIGGTVQLTDDILFHGRIDTVVKMAGSIYVMEHKTSSAKGYFCPKPNHQLSGYTFLTRILGYDCIGSIVNLLYVYSPNTKKTSNDKFTRIITARTEDELKEWTHWVMDIKCRIDSCLKGTWFPQYTNECYRCVYKEICNSTTQRDAMNVINSLYKVEPWEPWNTNDEV